MKISEIHESVNEAVLNKHLTPAMIGVPFVKFETLRDKVIKVKDLSLYINAKGDEGINILFEDADGKTERTVTLGSKLVPFFKYVLENKIDVAKMVFFEDAFDGRMMWNVKDAPEE